MFDVAHHLDELRSWPTARLVAHHEGLVREKRRLHSEDLDTLLVLDERGKVDLTLASRDGVSERSLHDDVETARALESLPAVAAAAHAGKLSPEQLGSVVTLADEASDAEWARAAHRTWRRWSWHGRPARCRNPPLPMPGRATRRPEVLVDAQQGDVADPRPTPGCGGREIRGHHQGVG